ELLNKTHKNVDDQQSKDYRIGSYLVHQQMAKIIIRSLRGDDAFEFSNKVVEILGHPEYEVRLVALELLTEYFLDNSVPDTDLSRNYSTIQSKLISMIDDGEPNLNCFRLVVELLVLINPKGLSFPLDSGLRNFWKKLFEHVEQPKNVSIVEAVFPLLGSLLSQIWDDKSSSQEFKSLCLKQWTEHVERNTKPEIALTLREATTKSLQMFSRHLFREDRFVNSNDVQQVITLYMILARLAQDDDVDLRKAASLIVAKAGRFKFPVDPDRARELCYEQVSNQFSKSLHLYAALLQILSGDEKPDEVFRAEMNRSRVLFAIENPNIFKEDLVDVQLASRISIEALKKEIKIVQFPDPLRNDIPRFA
ncbi:418_t:CDS:2, partial [Acaulospora morrowiae]